MLNTEIVDIVMSTLNIPKNLVLSVKTKIKAEEFISVCIESANSEEICNHFQINRSTVSRYIKKLSIPEVINANSKINNKLLIACNLKKCSHCTQIKLLENFYTCVTEPSGYRTQCKNCSSLNNKKQYIAHYTRNILRSREYYRRFSTTKIRRYIFENRWRYNAHRALRRARVLRATPIWADLAKIKDFYKNCPTGYEVDHKIPLVNSLVCGFHVYENLQYLTRHDNRVKHNKFDVESYVD